MAYSSGPLGEFVMVNGSGHLNSVVNIPLSPKPAPPRLLLELEPGYLVFFRNLADTLLFRKPKSAEITSAHADFWPDVFIPSRKPWLQFTESLLLHALVLAAVWGAGRALALRPQIVPRPALYKEDVIYYSPSEYLPPLDTGSSPSEKAENGEPEYARQPILSVPPEADNRSQTIITPPNIQLDHDVALPNIVSWGQTLPAPPLPSANPRAMPEMTAAIVAPAPDLPQPLARSIDTAQAAIVAPAPQVSSTGTRAIRVASTAVIAPPPSVQRDIRAVGDINVARAEVVAPAPQLPVRAQRTVGGITLAGDQARIIPPPPSVQSGAGIGGRGTGSLATSAAVVPPTPSVRGLSGWRRGPAINGAAAVVPPTPSIPAAVAGGSSGSGRQLIALSLHPAVGPPPVEVAGNRRGTFAATPEGKPGAPGTPKVAGDSHVLGGRGLGNGGGAGSGTDRGLPAGIHVGAGPKDAGASAIAGNPNGSPNGNSLGSGGSLGGSGNGASSRPSVDPKLLADNRPMRVNVKTQRAMESRNAATAEERQVFGARKSYSMVLNMPNLNSGEGSWVIRFAELKESSAAAGELVAPEATHKVDPGYPMELMRENVKGTVTLYAVIHSDGHVSDVRVLKSPDDRLDPFAQAALARWEFRPALKNGVPVALEAVIKIPFRPGRTF